MSDEKKDSQNQDEFAPIIPGITKGLVSYETLKNSYICEGTTPLELSERYRVPLSSIERFIKENKLDELRAAHVKHGLEKLRNIQVGQAEKLMDLETQFKKMRILQLEKTLEDYLAYFSKYGHFYKVHPITGEVLKDTNGIPMQIKIPNVSREIQELKESVTLSEGLKVILGQIDAIINKPKDVESLGPDIIDVTKYSNLFKQKSGDDED